MKNGWKGSDSDQRKRCPRGGLFRVRDVETEHPRVIYLKRVLQDTKYERIIGIN